MLTSMASSPKLSLIAIIFTCRALVFTLDSTIIFTSNSSLNWPNANSSNIETYHFPLQLIFRTILKTGADPELYSKYSDAIGFAVGFYCNIQHGDTCLLSIIMLDSRNGFPLANRTPQVVWVANRNHPVKENATLHFEPSRGLVLTEYDNHEVWSTRIRNGTLDASGMSLGGNGDLILFGSNHSTLWSSFDHPTDSLVIGQELRGLRSLTSRTSNYDSSVGRFSLSLTSSALTAFMQSDRHQSYLNFTPNIIPAKSKLQRVIYYGNNISFVYKKGSTYVSEYWRIAEVAPVRILTLGWDGGVRDLVWDSELGWSKKANTLGGYSECLLPLVCGDYAVCTRGGCICPTASDGFNYFKAIDPKLPNRGCSFLDPPIHNSTTLSGYKLADFGNLSYFSYSDPAAAAVTNFTEIGKCMQACEGNSSCKAAFFSYQSDTSYGLCYLISQVLTIIQGSIIPPLDLKTVAAIKVSSTSYPSHSFPPSLPPTVQIIGDEGGDNISRFSLRSRKTILVVVSVFVSVIVLCVIFCKIKRGWSCRRKDCFELVLGAPIRFTYKELSAATGKFSTRLGRGGFGTVFKGELKDGTVIAVKRLECVEQGTGEFLAEMKTMGSIHHYNLVKLIGFCADESNKLLVYEYMSNSSLDKWIFNGKGKQNLTWETRRRIILDVARGLAYLHEECCQRIAHLDMKPHNILLDDNFNARISDFGLARFIDRNQSQVVTAMRGTLGYLAPEWQNSRITVKADIYSFGVVILETVSGRMNLDYSQIDLDVHLLGILQRKAREDRLIDIVDKRILDRESHEEDIVKMIRIGAWCLNVDQSKRPSMSTVVKVLEGAVEMKDDIDFKFGHVLILSCETSLCS